MANWYIVLAEVPHLDSMYVEEEGVEIRRKKAMFEQWYLLLRSHSFSYSRQPKSVFLILSLIHI